MIEREGQKKAKKANKVRVMVKKKSRRAYLQKRTKRELELLERELANEEEVFAKVGGRLLLSQVRIQRQLVRFQERIVGVVRPREGQQIADGRRRYLISII